MLLGAKARGGIVLSLIGTAMAGMFFTSACTSGKVNAEGPAPVAVSMATVSVQTVPVIHEFVGQTSAKETVDLRARVSGFLEKVNFQEGAHVSAGQTLFEIEPASYQAALASAQALLARDRANLTKAVKDVARLRPLVTSHAAPEQDLDTAVAQQEIYEAAIKGDEASIADARLNLGYTVIRSPIDGVIGKLAVTRGNLVGKNENTLLATISSSSPMYVYFSVPEAQANDFVRKHVLNKQKVSQVELQLSDGSIYEQKGTINFADRAVDTSTGTLSLRGSFPNPKGLLRPGQFARVKVEGEQLQNAVLIPQKAVSELLNQRVVMTVDAKNVVGLQPVTIAGTHDDQFIISSGLKGGERIVVDGLQKVHAGATVVPAAASGAQSAGGR
jgi:membrane fusion protein (multidrug efflux system)